MQAKQRAGDKMRNYLVLPLLLWAPLACQQINYDAAKGNQTVINGVGGNGGTHPDMPATGSGPGPMSNGGGKPVDAGGVGAPVPPSGGPPCEMVRAQAYKIVKDNCSFCHQNAGALGGAFTFILDLPMLVNRPSPTGLSKNLLVPGDPDGSLMYFRVDKDQMPPADRAPRPSRQNDLPVLRDFISRCLASPPYTGWPLIGQINQDAGAAPLGPPGAPGGPCKAANSCDNGACCVFGLCRAAGQACGMSATGDVIPGVCMAGSCVDAGKRCGSLTEACCPPLGKCTAPHAACGLRTGKCEPCGGAGQLCCDFGGFCNDAHLSCIGGGGGGNPASCEPCGAPGQACCGEGVAADKKCDNRMACVHIAGTGPGKGDICPGSAPPAPDAGADAGGRDAGRGN
jgi:hypothetical protein